MRNEKNSPIWKRQINRNDMINNPACLPLISQGEGNKLKRNFEKVSENSEE